MFLCPHGITNICLWYWDNTCVIHGGYDTTSSKIYKLVSWIFVQIDDFNENRRMCCCWVGVNERFNSVSHFCMNGKGGWSEGVFKKVYVLDSTWVNVPSSEQYSSKDVKLQLKCWGFGMEWRKWCNCRAFQKGSLKGASVTHQRCYRRPAVSYQKVGGTVPSWVE